MRSRWLSPIVACLIIAGACGDNTPGRFGAVGTGGDTGSGAGGNGGALSASGGSGDHADAAADAAAPDAPAGVGGALGGTGGAEAGSGGTTGTGGAPAPSCTDQIKNGDETDVDCGGPCAGCAPGKKCGSGLDCHFGTCTPDGTCGNCSVAIDCPGIESECQHRTCVDGVCGSARQPDGTPTAVQSAGDCTLRVCDAAGNVITVADDSDRPDDGNPCTDDLCTNGVPSHANRPVSSTCGGNNYCDASGRCIGCATAADCPGPDTACRLRTCTQGACGVQLLATCDENGGRFCRADGACVQCRADDDCDHAGDTACARNRCVAGACTVVPEPSGTPAGDPTPGDCHANACDGQGAARPVPDDSDRPTDGNACTLDVCTAGVPSNPPAAAGTACGSSAGFRCDAAGACLPSFLVVRIGGGVTAALPNGVATAVFVEERGTSDGAKATEIALPIAASGANNAFALSGSGDSEGALALSGDGHYATLAGYLATPGTSSVSSGLSPRLVARIDAAGNVDTSTSLGTAAFIGDNVRSAVSNNGAQFWVCGNSGSGNTRGVYYADRLGATTSTLIESASKSTRVCQIAFGQLYCTAASNPYNDVFAVGVGLPTGSTSAALQSLTSDNSASPFGFVLLDRVGGDGIPDTLYVADDRAPPDGGIQKWTLSGGTWTQGATINAGLSTGVRGLAGYIDVGGSVVLIATTATASPTPNAIIRYVDTGSSTPVLQTLRAAVSSGVTIYRGVALAPR